MIQNTKNWLQSRIRRFYAKRTTCSDDVSLGLRNVYIFFSREGLLFGALLLITFITGINYGNNLVLGLCFYLASIWLISVHLTFSHVAGLQFRLLDVTMAEAGKPAWITLQIINSSSKPSRQLVLQFDHSEYIADCIQKYALKKSPLSSSLITTRVPRVHTQHTLTLPVMTTKRGKLILPRLSVSSVYPLGVMRAWSYVYFATPVWVYPKPTQFDWQPQDSLAADDSEHSHFSIKGQDDFDKLDDYQQGESLARVSWQHFARGHGMLTKKFCDAVGHEVTLNYHDMPASNHEQKLQQLTFVLNSVDRSHESFKLSLPNDQGKFGQGQDFIKECLLRLAKSP